MDIAERNNKELRRAGIKQLLLTCFMLIIQMTIFFISAGHIALIQPWIFFGVSFVHFSVSTAVIYKFNAELLVQRLKMKREGSRLWDEILMRMCNLIVLLVVPVVAGLDIGRFHWSSLDIHFAIIGFLLLFVSTVLIDWAMVVNPHFEPTVRIQRERGHKVITSGPYKIIRHPGYLGGILFTLSIPLIIGSLVTFIPAGVYTFLMIIRTWLEDRILIKELNRYSEYAKRVRYRLFPGIW